MPQLLNLIGHGTVAQSILAFLGLVLIGFVCLTIAVFFVMFWVLVIREAVWRQKKGGPKSGAPDFQGHILN